MNTILCPHKANSDNIFYRPKGKKCMHTIKYT